MINKIYKDTETRMEKCFEIFKRHISKIYTERISPAILGSIQIEYHGKRLSLHQLSNISTENSNALIISVFDKSMIPILEKALIISGLDLNFYSIGTGIRISLPALTEERRHGLVKLVRTEAERTRVSIRNIRRDTNDKIKNLLKQKDINKDEDYRMQNDIQKLTDSWIKKLDALLARKEIELMKI